MTRPALHEMFVRLGRRGFCAYCSCGWGSPYDWSKAATDQALASHAAAHAAVKRHVLTLLACATLAIAAVVGAGCASAVRAAPDADTALPSCASEGCGDGQNLSCTRDKVDGAELGDRCGCPQPDGAIVACLRAQLPDAGADANADADADAKGPQP